VPLREELGFGRRWLRWMHKNGVRHWVVPCTLLASALVRWCIGLGSYSGTSDLIKNARVRGDVCSTLTLAPHLCCALRAGHSAHVWGL